MATAINNNGQIVGYGFECPFLCSNSVMQNLNNLIDPASGWTLEYANAINDLGQIVGQGINWNLGGQSRAFLLSPTFLPTITVNPESQNAAVGSTVQFYVSTTNGTAPLFYQWYFGMNALSWATDKRLVLTNIQPSQSGGYSVVVSNAAGSVTSQTAMLERPSSCWRVHDADSRSDRRHQTHLRD